MLEMKDNKFNFGEVERQKASIDVLEKAKELFLEISEKQILFKA